MSRRAHLLFPMAKRFIPVQSPFPKAEKVQLLQKAPAGSGFRGCNNAGAPPAPFLRIKSNAKCSGMAAPNSRKQAQDLGSDELLPQLPLIRGSVICRAKF